MNTQHTYEKLISLKLHGMAGRYKAIMDAPIHQQPEMHSLLALLTEAEEEYRVQNRSDRYLRQSRLRYDAVIEQVNCSIDRGLSKEAFLKLCDNSYIKKGQNILISGSTGCGKSFLACSLGRLACDHGYPCSFFPVNRLMDELAAARLDGSYRKVLKKIERTPLIVLDDLGLKTLDLNSSLALIEILDDRYKRGAVIVTSQLPVDKWYELFDEATHADAFMDRLTANSHKIDLKGGSLRKG
ncbi:IS21-like element helper ATPase IstB [Chitinophaga sancti]|uniref:IS21-like element helper ATPase IstB n=1 Tax=Chitinophaga sancti TaxID=1004 RepID=UPI002A75B00F|nr:IS21-like element helper ATPase IstB [Chitinophaga sancti]WPQ63332.1 IS21-like element helper ATPase IstB [Chitinophaga sancti]